MRRKGMHLSCVGRLGFVVAAACALLLGCSGGSSSATTSRPGVTRAAPVGEPAFRYGMVDALMSPAEGAEVIGVDGELQYVSASFVAIDGEVLLIRKVSCGRCRRVMGWSFVGEPARMSDDELRELQRRLGLDAAVAPLRSFEAWRGVALPSLASPR